MIKGNRIIFGHGDVLAGHDLCGLYFRYSDKKYKIGTAVKCSDNDDTVLEAHIKISNFDDLSSLRNKLESVKTSDNKIFVFDNYIFDFTDFNIESVDIVLRELKRLSTSYMWLLPFCA